jgi:hypothetical protein
VAKIRECKKVSKSLVHSINDSVTSDFTFGFEVEAVIMYRTITDAALAASRPEVVDTMME